MEPITTYLGLKKASEVIESIKTLYNVVKKAGNAELQQHLMDVQEKVLGLQQDFGVLLEENSSLRKKLTESEDWKTIQKSLIPEKNSYWIEKDKKKDGPFCTGCTDIKRQLIRMHMWTNGDFGATCPVCNRGVRYGNPPISNKLKSEFDPFNQNDSGNW